LADPAAPSLSRDATLEDAVEGLATTGFGVVPVLDEHRRILGVVTAAEVVRGYRLALQTNLRSVGAAAPAGTVLVEGTLGPDSPLLGRSLRELRLPVGTVVMAILRDDSLLVPGHDDRLQVGDDLMLLVPEGKGDHVRTLLVGAAGDGQR
jgi:CBS domain-containing protein